MQLMGENVQESDRNLTVYGCSSHWLNLLGQNVKVFHLEVPQECDDYENIYSLRQFD